MESNAFGSSHLPSQALVVLSEAASGLHEALRGQRPFPTRLPDAKDLHNMSLVGNYSTHLLHSFHPHLLQTLNHNMLAANGAAGGPASYFASERATLGKPSVLSNFSLPSAFSPPKYIGISLDQNLFNGSESFRTDSASPTCTSHESMEGSQDYDGEKGESPRSNNSQDPRDLRHMHNKATPACSSASSSSSSSSSAPPASTPTLVPSTASLTAGSPTVVAAHLAQHQHQHQQQQHHHAHHSAHHHHTHPHLPQHALPPPSHHAHHHHGHPNGSLLAATMGGLGMTLRAGMSLASLSSASGALSGGGAGNGSVGNAGGPVPDICPVCGIKLSNADEWNSHFLAELDRLYKLSAGMERTNLQATYMFAPPCPTQENAIRTSHNRWETFQRIRNNRQNRLRIKVRKRKYGEMYMMENVFCNSCPICKRKYTLDGGKLPTEDETKMQEEIETVDVESCNDDVPDSGSELQPTQLTHISNMHNSNNQPGKLDGILYRTACVINKEATVSVSGGSGGGEDDVTTNVATTSSGPGGGGSNWSDMATTPTQGHISVKNVSELSSTTHHFYNADSCGDERSLNGSSLGMGGGGSGGIGSKDLMMDTCNNDSDEDVIVDDDDSVKMTTTATPTTTNSYCINNNNKQKRKYEDTVGSSSRATENNSPVDERPRSEPQVTSSEQSMEITNTNNNNNNNSNNNNNNHMKYAATDNVGNADTMATMPTGLTQLDTKVGISSDLKPDDENKCFICKTGIKDLASDSFFRGRNLYFHQSCANVMSSYRMSKELLQQQQQQQQRTEQQSGSSSQTQICLSPAHSPQQSVAATTNIE